MINNNNINNNTNTNSVHDDNKKKKLHVVLIHLDLGIGGAEQLMLQLAQCCYDCGYDIDICTTRCEPNHCFASVKPTTGVLHKHLHIWGTWIPHTIMGKYGQAAFSTIRLLYLAYKVCQTTTWSSSTSTSTSTASSSSSTASSQRKYPDLIVMDVLSTPLPLLQYMVPKSALLFYCHFPDKLLIRSNNNSNKTRKSLYRTVLDWLEETTMIYSDVTVVNSEYTKRVVLETFPSLQSKSYLPVLYPALEIDADDDNNSNNNDNSNNNNNESSSHSNSSPNTTIETETKQNKFKLVSLNRYERKKNLSLFIETMAWIRDECNYDISQIDIIIAGGYDKKNIENVQYYIELQQLANQFNVSVQFLQSISDKTRTELLKTATGVIYTPSNEHFGIVPLEAMYYKTPVIACNSGGPVETIMNESTGYLCLESTPQCFGIAILKLLSMDDKERCTMGNIAKQHVLTKFGPTRLRTEWITIVEETIKICNQRNINRSKQTIYQRYFCNSNSSPLWLVLLFFIVVLVVVPIIVYVVKAYWSSPISTVIPTNQKHEL